MQKLSLEDVISMFDHTAERACHELDVSTTTMKKFCRSHNIQRWPYRKVEALKKEIETTKIELETKMLTGREKKKKIARLKDRQERLRKIRDPNSYRVNKVKNIQNRKMGNSYPQYSSQFMEQTRNQMGMDLEKEPAYFPSPGNGFTPPVPQGGAPKRKSGGQVGMNPRFSRVQRPGIQMRSSPSFGVPNNRMNFPNQQAASFPTKFGGENNFGGNGMFYQGFGFRPQQVKPHNLPLNKRFGPFFNNFAQSRMMQGGRPMGQFNNAYSKRSVNFNQNRYQRQPNVNSGQMNQSGNNFMQHAKSFPQHPQQQQNTMRTQSSHNISQLSRPNGNNTNPRSLRSFQDLMKDVNKYENNQDMSNMSELKM